MILKNIITLILETKEHTQQYRGRHQLIKRLTAQLGGDNELAIRILINRGHLEPDGKTLTPAGQIRDNMTARERALDRAAAHSKHPPEHFKYIAKTNKTVLKDRYKRK
jgi:hypothetical protein